jgi:hypothetical protein
MFFYLEFMQDFLDFVLYGVHSSALSISELSLKLVHLSLVRLSQLF